MYNTTQLSSIWAESSSQCVTAASADLVQQQDLLSLGVLQPSGHSDSSSVRTITTSRLSEQLAAAASAEAGGGAAAEPAAAWPRGVLLK